MCDSFTPRPDYSSNIPTDPLVISYRFATAAAAKRQSSSRF
jgi:hypothetical protein